MPPTEPSPKRQKLSPTTEQPPPSTPKAGQDAKTNQTSDTPSNRDSWYNRSWPRKAAPITQVARESISSASTVAAETASIIKDKVAPSPVRKSSLALTLGKQTSNKSLPVGATTTTDHAMPEGRTPSIAASVKSDVTLTEANHELGTTKNAMSTQKAVNDKQLGKGQALQQNGSISAKDKDGQPLKEPDTVPSIAPRSWIGWLGRTEDIPQGSSTNQVDTAAQAATRKQEQPPTPTTDSASASSPSIPVEQTKQIEQNQSTSKDVPETKPKAEAALRRSWLPVWNNAAASHSAPDLSPTSNKAVMDSKGPPTSQEGKDSVAKPPTDASAKPMPIPARVTERSEDSSKASSVETSLPQPQNSSQTGQKPSAWVFWSRPDRTTTDDSKQGEPHQGEIAISHTPSQDRPKRASIDVPETSKSNPEPPKNKTPVASVDKQADKKEAEVKKHQKQDSKASVKSIKAENAKASAVAIESARSSSPASIKKPYEHQLLPRFHETLKLAEDQTLWQKLAQLFSQTPTTGPRHLSLVKETPRIKNALAIGVHGYFPAPLIRSVIGQPTGTSIKFADMAAKSIKRWTTAHGYDCKVETAALEGEGKIADRVDLLWKLLLNWIEKIRKADFVMIACHSQGVPVAMMLVAKLIHFGCLTANRVGVCAMAGINMGPFPEFKSRWISGSAGELFEFSDPTSKVSVDYLAAVEDVLKFGARVTYIGSIDDQLVSLESSIFAPISHPHIYRAVSIDARVHAPSFLSHLVAFALKLRNLGVQDHGLIKELSGPLAGSLYSGEGHSRIYEDEAVYDLAVSFALETTASLDMAISQRNVVSSAGNPYILPFAMRGILEEDFVKEDLQGEVGELLREFDEWRPGTKALKDVKFRLEGIRSKL